MKMQICREKGSDFTQFYDKIPYTNRKFKKQNDNAKRHHNNFYNTAIPDRLYMLHKYFSVVHIRDRSF